MAKVISTNHKSLLKKALNLEYATIGWNIFEGLTSITIGLILGSISLLSYGLESSVEVFASAVVVWDLKGGKKHREKLALRLIGLAYLVVSAYIFIDASGSFLRGTRAERSFIGIFLMIITVLGMGTLGFLKRGVGSQMKSPTVIADAKFTLIDASLAGAVLVGLLLNTLFGWWWADQAMALFLSGIAFREGVKSIL